MVYLLGLFVSIIILAFPWYYLHESVITNLGGVSLTYNVLALSWRLRRDSSTSL